MQLIVTFPTAGEDEFPWIALDHHMGSKGGRVEAVLNLTPVWPAPLRAEAPELLPALREGFSLAGARKVEHLVISIQWHRVSLLVILGTEGNVPF